VTLLPHSAVSLSEATTATATATQILSMSLPDKLFGHGLGGSGTGTESVDALTCDSSPPRGTTMLCLEGYASVWTNKQVTALGHIIINWQVLSMKGQILTLSVKVTKATISPLTALSHPRPAPQHG
jgi:hypothetical protein